MPPILLNNQTIHAGKNLFKRRRAVLTPMQSKKELKLLPRYLGEMKIEEAGCRQEEETRNLMRKLAKLRE